MEKLNEIKDDAGSNRDHNLTLALNNFAIALNNIALAIIEGIKTGGAGK